tara:strand:- start:962 stop:1135 length:174 start_codon:yes stop_codon:yes gene_type:complete
MNKGSILDNIDKQHVKTNLEIERLLEENDFDDLKTMDKIKIVRLIKQRGRMHVKYEA